MARTALVNSGISFPHLTPPACLGHPSSAGILGKLENFWMLKFDGNRLRKKQSTKKQIPLSSRIPWEKKALVRKSLNFALDLERKFSIILDLGFVSKALGHLQRGVFSLWRRGAEIFGIFHGAGLEIVAFSECFGSSENARICFFPGRAKHWKSCPGKWWNCCLWKWQ